MLMGFLLEKLQEYPSEIIALCALFLTLYHGLQTRKHNRLTVRPHLTTFSHSHLEQGACIRFKANLANRGLGPAIIKGFHLVVDDRTHEVATPEEMMNIANEYLGKDRIIPGASEFAVYRKNGIIGKDEERTIANVLVKAHSPEDMQLLKEKVSKFHVLIEYLSAYGEAFKYDSRKHARNKSFSDKLVNWRKLFRIGKAVQE